jgi:hypothetical protein
VQIYAQDGVLFEMVRKENTIDFGFGSHMEELAIFLAINFIFPKHL